MSTAVGDKISDFELVAHNGDKVKLSERLADGAVVLAFFPMAFTGVCTAEMCEFRDSIKEFEALKANVFGVSVDSRFSLNVDAKKFIIETDMKMNNGTINARNVSIDPLMVGVGIGINF